MVVDHRVYEMSTSVGLYEDIVEKVYPYRLINCCLRDKPEPVGILLVPNESPYIAYTRHAGTLQSTYG
jgi:hypothetical protein